MSTKPEEIAETRTELPKYFRGDTREEFYMRTLLAATLPRTKEEVAAAIAAVRKARGDARENVDVVVVDLVTDVVNHLLGHSA